MSDDLNNLSDRDLAGMQERNEQTLSDIKNLQKIEEELDYNIIN